MWKSEPTGYGHVEMAIKQALPPCQIKCPINEDIQRTNVLISLLPPDNEAKAKDGIIQISDYLFDRNPFFGICGYICGLCELECNYKNKGGAIRRRLLKRFLVDRYLDYLKNREEMDIARTKENIAIVGGGPGGLMCAFMLSRRGYRVTVFESSNRLGGALWLIPDYRLPKHILTETIDTIVKLAGIEVKYNAKLGTGRLTLDRLRNDGYRAVFVALGSPYPRVLTFDNQIVQGQDLSGVMYGQTYLYEVSHDNITSEYFRGRNVVVLGGGNVAMDVARSAKRHGAEVKIVALEREDKNHRDGIPADEEELRGAWEEGVEIIYSRGVQRIIGEGGKFKAVYSPRCVSVFDEKGFNPQFDLEDCITIRGDVLIISIGQSSDKRLLEREGLLDERGSFVLDPFTLQSSLKPWVFVGGDVRKIGFMVEAMREGMVAAESIERFLSGFDMREGRKRDYDGYQLPVRCDYKTEPEVLWIPPEKRTHFQLVEKGFKLKEAIEEAKRCATCGPCLSCKACVSIGFQKSLSPVQVNVEKCSGCGICHSVCNYEAAFLITREDRVISSTDMFKCKSCGMCVVACPSEARRMPDDDTYQRIEKTLAALA
jgi:NADPH-dependent glutamate synthase beta subunit-like oxidoreductase/Fe-S-cluster-containing hydrogenase component 2